MTDQRPYYTTGANKVFRNVKDGQDLVFAISRFALELYKEQGERSEGKNLFMSPLGISAVLSMAYLGARGKTLKEMKKTLCFDNLEDERIHEAFSDFIEHLKKCSKESAFQLHMANRLYGEESFKILDEFQNACRNHYDAELIPVSFMNASDKAIAAINNWVEESTNKRIKDILTPESVDASTVLVLINAIYFKSAWFQKFKSSDTQEADFLISKDATIKVQMMFRKVERTGYYYSNDLSCQVLRLPYHSLALSMFILLPDKTSSSLDDLEKKITAEQLANIDSEFQDFPEVNLWLPKFKMEENLELKEVLGNMGMKSIFAPESADLSGIDGGGHLYASAAVHKAFVDVNEEGTEAAAATAMKMLCGSCLVKEKPVEFRADHPFLFFIREERAKVILFLGRAVAPKHS